MASNVAFREAASASDGVCMLVFSITERNVSRSYLPCDNF
jgi:hypothetical protein